MKLLISFFRYSFRQQNALAFTLYFFLIMMIYKLQSHNEIPSGSKKDNPHVVQLIYLNEADSVAWDALPGIGPVLASRILKYKSFKGCFDSVPELLNVYGISKSWYERWESYLQLGNCNEKKYRQRKDNKSSGYSSGKYVINRPLSPLDLNTVDSLELLQYYLIPPFLVKNIIRARALNTCFTSWLQISRISGMLPENIDSLKAWTIIGECPESNSEPISTPDNFRKNKKDFIPIALNSATVEELRKIPGLSKSLAYRVIQFRDKLGFYLSTDQLSEIKDAPDWDTWAAIIPYFEVQLPSPDRADSVFLKINEMDISQLSKHPYVGFSLARRIVNYREQHGRFVSINSLSKIYGVKPGSWEKILPYILF